MPNRLFHECRKDTGLLACDDENLCDESPSPAVIGECRCRRRRSAWLPHCQELKDLCVFVVRKSNKLLAQIPAEHSWNDLVQNSLMKYFTERNYYLQFSAIGYFIEMTHPSIKSKMNIWQLNIHLYILNNLYFIEQNRLDKIWFECSHYSKCAE